MGEALIESLLGGYNLNYRGHRCCVRKDSARDRNAKEREESDTLAYQKAEVVIQEQGQLERTTIIRAWIIAMSHRLNDTDLSRDEFQDNLCLRYGLMPLNLPSSCNGCGKKFTVEHALSCPNGGLFPICHNDAAIE